MRIKLSILSLVAALLCVGAASAGNGPNNKIRYSFLGQLTATPANGGVSITVAGRQQGRAAGDARPARHADVRVRREDRVPEVVEGHPDGRAGRRPRRRRLRVGSRARAARLDARRRSSRLRPASSAITARSSSSPSKPLYLFRGTLSAVGSSNVTVHVTGGDRRALRLLIGSSSRPDVHLRREHDLPALAGQGADRHRRLEARRRRQDRRPDPRRQGLVASPRSTSTPANKIADREPRRRRASPTAGPEGALNASFAAVLQSHYADGRRRSRRYEHEPSPLHAPRRHARRGELLLLARPGGFALPRRSSTSSSARSLIRAEVIVQSPSGVQDWRIDRGVITSASPARDHAPREGRHDGTIQVVRTRRDAGPGTHRVRGQAEAAAARRRLPPGESSGRARAGRGRRRVEPEAMAARRPGRPSSRRGRRLDRPARQGISRAAGRWRVVWLRTGEEAVAELRRHPVRLVVLDIGLPGIDGFEVCRQMRAQLEGADRDAHRARRGARPRRRARARRRRLRLEAVLAARARGADQGDPAPRRAAQRGRGAHRARHRASPRLARRHRRRASRSS